MSYDFEVQVNGKLVTKYFHEGRQYIEGRRGSDYVLRFNNNTSKRVIVVFSVDGLSVMHGNTAGFDDPGYVVEPFKRLTVPGWRLDNDAVAKFKFGDRAKSYAEKSGQAGNVGVIGCVVFEEAAEPWLLFNHTATTICNSRGVSRGITGTTTSDGSDLYWRPGDGPAYSSSDEVKTSGGILRSSCVDTRHTTCTNEVSSSTYNLGTEFGKRDHHKVQEVVLRRASEPSTIIEVHYDSREGLEARGINLGHKVTNVAKAFPNDTYSIGCTPPAGWRGRP